MLRKTNYGAPLTFGLSTRVALDDDNHAIRSSYFNDGKITSLSLNHPLVTCFKNGVIMRRRTMPSHV